MKRVIALLGLRCSGKSTVGARLARLLARPFVDLDLEVVAQGRREGRREERVGALLAAVGEGRFRALEAAAMRRTVEPEPSIVLATGGGVVEREDCRAWLTRTARSVFLDVPLERLQERLAQDSAERPALLGGGDPAAELAILRARREPLYRALAELVVECGARAPDPLAAEIARALALEPVAGALPG